MPGTELAEYKRRQATLMQEPPSAVRPLLNAVAARAGAGDFANARRSAARLPDVLWRDRAYTLIARQQAMRDANGAKTTAQFVSFPLERLLALVEIAASLAFGALIGSGKPGYAMAVPQQVQEYEARRRPPPSLTPAQVAKRFAEARATLTEAKQLLPLVRTPELRQLAYVALAYHFALAQGFADAKRMNAAIARPADRLYSLCAIADGLLESGDPRGAKNAARQAQTIAASLKESKDRSYEQRQLFKVFLYTADLVNAYAVARSLRESYDRANSFAQLATVLAQVGGKTEARRLIAEARAESATVVDSVSIDRCREYLVYALVALPDIADAKRTAATIFDPTMRARAQKAIADAER